MPRRSLRGVLVNLALFCVSTLVGLLVCEAILRTVVRVGSFEWRNDGPASWSRDHPELEYVLTPGYRGHLVSPDFSHTVAINTLGFRGPEPVDTDRPTFVLGDSFTFGVGVEVEQAIPARVEHSLRQAGRRVDVWNLGVPSHSPPQYRRTLDAMLAHAVPSRIVVCLFAGRLPSDANDLWGAVRFEELRDTRPQPEPLAEASPGSGRRPTRDVLAGARRTYRWITRRSALGVVAAQRLAPTLRALRHRDRQLVEWERERFERGWTLLRRDLAAMAETADALGAAMMVVHIPESSDVINGSWSTFERLDALAADLGVPFVGFRHWGPGEGRALYYPVDGHLTAEGCDRVARSVARAITEHASSTPLPASVAGAAAGDESP